MADDKTSKDTGAKAKKEKPPAIEDKPFSEFISQHFIPELAKTLTDQGLADMELELKQQPLPVPGADQDPYWQVIGHWNGGKRQFNLGFSKEDIKGSKFFCASDSGSSPSILESFMIDERKVTLDLMVLYTVQRLNGQKWLTRN